MTRYVLGFMFDEQGRDVALITKAKPDWQRGLLNGIGGKVEEGEFSDDAIVREFEEETGVATRGVEWRNYVRLISKDFTVDVFKSFNTHFCYRVKTMTDEQVSVVQVKDILFLKTISNLPWLIHMALDSNNGQPFRAVVNYSPVIL